MLHYILRRFLYMIPTLFGITLVTFAIVNLAPGDPVQVVQGGSMSRISPEAYREMLHQYGLDKPWYVRYVIWVKNLATLDFGTSFKDNRRVSDKILEALPKTLALNGAALLVALMVALPVGLYAAVRQHSLFDKLSGGVLYMLYSLPSFWIALVLISLVSVKLKFLPFVGDRSDSYDTLSMLGKLWDRLSHLILPTICLTYVSLAYLSRFARGVTLEVIRQDYIRTARAKGLDERTVLFRHAFRNTLVPVVTLLGLLLPSVLSGSIIIEKIFSWPGTGKLFIDAALGRDYPTVMGESFLSAVAVLVCTLLADISYAFVDPRIRYQ